MSLAARLGRVLLLLLVAVACCVWLLPASFVIALLPTEVGRVAQIHRVTGTLWRGEALLTVSGVPPTLPLGWSCRPALAPLGVGCDITGAVNGVLAVSVLDGRLSASRVTGALPVRFAAANAVAVQSPRVVLDAPELSISRSENQVRGVLRASEARYRLGGNELALGEVTLECTPNPDRTSACALSNRGGDARLDGRLQIKGSRASGTVEFTPNGSSTQRVSF